MIKRILMLASFMIVQTSTVLAQNAEPIDEIIARGTIQTDPAMSAWIAGDFATAEVEFKKNAFCALRARRNFESAVESARENETRSVLSADVGASASSSGAANSGVSTSSSQASSTARLNTNNFKNKNSETKRACNNRGFQIYMTGLSQLKLGKRAEAKKSFERASAMRRSLYDAHYRLSLLAYQDGDLKEAAKRLKRLRKLESRYKSGEANKEIRAQIAYLTKLLG